jgi:hypothetical protein
MEPKPSDGLLPAALRDGLMDRPPRPPMVILPDPDAAPDLILPDQPPAAQLLADVALALAYLVLVAAVVSIPALLIVEFAAPRASAWEVAGGAAIWAVAVYGLFLTGRRAGRRLAGRG